MHPNRRLSRRGALALAAFIPTVWLTGVGLVVVGLALGWR